MSVLFLISLFSPHSFRQVTGQPRLFRSVFVWNTLSSRKEVVHLSEDYSGDLGFLSSCYYKVVKNQGSSVSLLWSCDFFSCDSLFYSISFFVYL